jgi:hypothetical protein
MDPIAALSSVHWGDPRVVAVVVVLLILALVRRWSLVLVALLVWGLAEGLEYLLQHSALGAGVTKGVVIGVYGFGGLLFLFLAIAQFLTKE